MATIKLFEAWVQSQAVNELAPHGQLDLAILRNAADIRNMKNVGQLGEGENLQYERIKTLLKRNGINFSVSAEEAAIILTNFVLRYKDSISVLGIPSGIDAWFKKTGDVKLMDFPEDPAKVLTTGIFTEDSIEEPADDSQGSVYGDIALYCNNSALISIVQHLNQLMNYNSSAGLSGAGYALSVDPTSGTMKWSRQYQFQIKFYGTSTTSSAQSKQAVTVTTWEVPATGKTIVKKLPGTMFATGSAVLADSKELDAAIAELKALLTDKNTKLANIEIESSASGDRPAADGKSGYPANWPKGKPYMPKQGDESGNAKLAFDRAGAIKAKLTSLGIPTSIKAIIQDGGDAAQYAKLTVTVQKADKPTEVLSKTDLETILLKPKQTTGLASTKTLSVWTAASNYQAMDKY